MAVVYAVMIETGLNQTELGKLVLAACFVTDFGTVLALGVIFANFNGWLALFVGVTDRRTLRICRGSPRYVIKVVGNRRVSMAAGVGFVFLVLFLLGGLAKAKQSETRPAGIRARARRRGRVRERQGAARADAVDRVLDSHALLLHQGRPVRLAPERSGDRCSADRRVLAVQMAAKFVGVVPLTRAFRCLWREPSPRS